MITFRQGDFGHRVDLECTDSGGSCMVNVPTFLNGDSCYFFDVYQQTGTIKLYNIGDPTYSFQGTATIGSAVSNSFGYELGEGACVFGNVNMVYSITSVYDNVTEYATSSWATTGQYSTTTSNAPLNDIAGALWSITYLLMLFGLAYFFSFGKSLIAKKNRYV